VYPPTEQADKMLANPQHPPDYQDAIITFPNTGIQPIYISLSVTGDHGYHPAPKGLTAFPDATKDKSKSSVQRGGKNVHAGRIPKVVFTSGTASMERLKCTTDKGSIWVSIILKLGSRPNPQSQGEPLLSRLRGIYVLMYHRFFTR
jgi:hypothetical protein